ncbi:MAG: hypothetical protein ACI9OH_001368 [Oleispira sp.]|jgi:hypothetical protein
MFFVRVYKMQLSVMSSHKQAMKPLSALKSLLVRGLFFSLALSAVQAHGADRSKIMEAFPRAELVEETQLNNAEYRLVLSGLKRKRATTSGEVERLISGDINRQFWQISTNHEVEQILEHFLKQWQGAQVMYRCSGLDCGSSNFWANDIFSNAKLYGRDANQSYVVAMIPGNPNRIYVLYAVQRSKQKLYFNLDQITSSDALTNDNVERQNILSVLQKESGWLEGLNTVDGRIDEKQSEILLSTLKELDVTIKRRLYLVVHCYQANNMADNFACSTRLAQQLRAAIYQDFEIPVFGHGALTLPPGKDLKPQLRFMLWPRHQ